MIGAVPLLSATVVICTRDRPSDLRRAVVSVLRAQGDFRRVLVVDQSGGRETEEIVTEISERDQRLSYVKSHRTGLSVARNLALHAVDTDLVLFTDDDCEVAPDWAETMIMALSRDAGAGLAFGNVVPAACDPRDGFIVGYSVPSAARLTGRLAKCRDGGIGANMAVKVNAARQIGGFDEVLGAGGYFPSCEDGDFAYRVLKNHFAILHIVESTVVHYGLRDWAAGSGLTRQTYMGIGAAYFKHVRSGDAAAGIVLGQQFALSVREVLVNLALRRKPVGFGRLAYLGRGVLRSYEKKVDRSTGLYVGS